MRTNSLRKRLLAYTPVYLSRMHSDMLDVMKDPLTAEEENVMALERM